MKYRSQGINLKSFIDLTKFIEDSQIPSPILDHLEITQMPDLLPVVLFSSSQCYELVYMEMFNNLWEIPG